MNNDHGNTGLFGIKIGESNQEFYAAVRQINSVSLQEYVTAAYNVTEVVIDMIGSSVQLRIYNTELIDPMKLADQASKNLPMGAGAIQKPDFNMPDPVKDAVKTINKSTNLIVNKEYPVTTHAKTIEFRVASKEEGR